MRVVVRYAVVPCLLGLVAACSSAASVSSRSGPCALGELAGCGAVCTEENDCQPGLFCGKSGLCSAECTSATASRDCGAGDTCSSDGHCTSPEPSRAGRSDAGLAADAGAGPDATVPIFESPACGDVKVEVQPAVPNVFLIIDQSGSMRDAPLGAYPTRWEALRDVLLGEQGIIASFEQSVRFGLVLYTSHGGLVDGEACPLLTQVDLALDNFDAIRAVYQDAEPDRDTPTGDAISAVTDQVQSMGVSQEAPTIFVLATDGEPDTCENPDSDESGEAVAAVERAFSLGIRTYIVAVAQEDELSQEHVNAMASAGVGMTDAESYRVDDDMGLRAALRTVIGRELSCVVPIGGMVTPSDECDGKASLAGEALSCPSDFKLVDGPAVELSGTACDRLKAGAQLDLQVPCGAVPR